VGVGGLLLAVERFFESQKKAGMLGKEREDGVTEGGRQKGGLAKEGVQVGVRP
jgi:hypothetical protein